MLPVWKGFLANRKPEETPENPHWRETLHLPSVWKELLRKRKPEETHEDPHRRKTLHVP